MASPAAARVQLPCVFFMGAGVVGDIAAQLRADGVPPDMPAALVPPQDAPELIGMGVKKVFRGSLVKDVVSSLTQYFA